MCHRYLAVYFVFLLARIITVNLQETGPERTIQNPGFVETSPCSCDISANLCDFNCCCDNDCTAKDKDRFESCIPGLAGGQDGATEDYKCDTNAFNLPDWHALTCVYWETNAYLGMFYMNKAKIAKQEAFIPVSAKYLKNEFSLREQEARYTDKDYSTVAYRKGIILSTIQPNVPQTGLLSLPQPIDSIQCNRLAPVRFLEPAQSSCPSQLTDSSCSSLSIFSANMYAVSSAITTGNRPFQITIAYKGQEVADTEVRYHCATDLTGFLPSTETPLGSMTSNDDSNFPNNLQNVDCEDPCSDDTCWQYNTDRTFTSVYDRPLPARCAFDDGKTLPPTPSLIGSTCNNAVLEVRYSFEWAGPNIEKLTADVVLADVTGVSSVPRALAQRFSVKWSHRKDNTTTSDVDDNFYNSSQPYQRSGIAGYDPGRPLQSGCMQTEPTSNVFQTVDTQGEKQMGVWRPGVDGLCEKAQREAMTFGEDMMSSCALRLTFNDLNACDNLRKLIGNHLNVLMPSDVIGRYGYNDPNSQDSWVSVLRQNLTAMYQSATTTSTSPLTPLVGNETAFRLADSIAGVCLLPTSVNLIILYAKTGAINIHPRQEVVGASINFTLGNWTMECMGSNSQRCLATSGQTQNFFLHSTVRFIQVPPTPPAPKSSFYNRVDPETCDTDTCNRFLDYWATDLCYYDTCWQELAYPLTSVYEGDSHEYALAFFLVLVLGVVGYAAVAKPGWD